MVPLVLLIKERWFSRMRILELGPSRSSNVYIRQNLDSARCVAMLMAKDTPPGITPPRPFGPFLFKLALFRLLIRARPSFQFAIEMEPGKQSR